MAKKQELREIYRDKRKGIPIKELSQASCDIFRFVMDSKLLQGDNIMLYMANEQLHELPLTMWFSSLECFQICVPKVLYAEGHMEAVLWKTDAATRKNKWGILEPLETEVVHPLSITTVVVPMLCFDKAGHRVGYGKGFYDRFLKRCTTTVRTIGVSYFDAIDRIDDVHSGDFPLDYVVTPNRVYAF